MKKTPSVPLTAYNLAISNEGPIAAPLEEEDEEDPLCPAGPVKTAVASAEVALAVPEAVAVELVSLAEVGLLAPQGWSCLHALAQLLSEPQFFSHWFPHSVQTKYGRVREYSDTLGCVLSPQRHPYVRVSCEGHMCVRTIAQLFATTRSKDVPDHKCSPGRLCPTGLCR